jgi:hypothetical protein
MCLTWSALLCCCCCCCVLQVHFNLLACYVSLNSTFMKFCTPVLALVALALCLGSAMANDLQMSVRVYNWVSYVAPQPSTACMQSFDMQTAC